MRASAVSGVVGCHKSRLMSVFAFGRGEGKCRDLRRLREGFMSSPETRSEGARLSMERLRLAKCIFDFNIAAHKNWTCVSDGFGLFQGCPSVIATCKLASRARSCALFALRGT